MQARPNGPKFALEKWEKMGAKMDNNNEKSEEECQLLAL